MKRFFTHKEKLSLFILVSLAFFHIELCAQGCSDAGACTIKGLSPFDVLENTEKKNSIYLGFTAGSADHSIFAGGAHLGFTHKFGNAFSIDGKITYALRNGNDISVSGLGDVFAILNYDFSPHFTASAGVKLPLNEANRALEGRMLPMDYQTSLGTPDLILGFSYQRNKWMIGLGYQQPLDQNQNLFIPSEWPAESPLSEFVQTGVYDRSGDILMRIGRVIPLNEKLTITPSLLPIYHIREDYDYLTFEQEKIEGSSGLTINATLHGELQSGSNNLIHFSIGFPLLVREVRPDGLTRSFVAGVEYVVSF